VLKVRPRRDDFGRVVAPAHVWLRPQAAPRMPSVQADGWLTLPSDWLARTTVGDTLELTDARGADRVMTISAEDGSCRWAEARQTMYLMPDTELRLRSGRGGEAEVRVGPLPPRSEPILLERGDMLVLTRGDAPGRPAERDGQGRVIRPARIPCSIPGIFADLRAGERIWLDDGRIGGLIRAVTEGEVHVQITQARDGGDRLLADKGINLPDSALHLPALTAKDIEDLPFVAKHADLVGMSFVQRESDVRDLQEHLRRLGAGRLGIVLKIETRAAFENLPDLLLAALANPAVGVMIARGDLAVECGYERLAEVQEEILWLSEAAHVPVIWATQVLENLAKTGLPSRAEITDAAMSERAECVMLNKGPHILEAIHTLDDILRRMQDHQRKKVPTLRRLRAWGDLGAEGPSGGGEAPPIAPG
jgi:pyruvate kinase